MLDGEKQCTDLLTPQDYVRAGERLARTWAGMAARMLRTMPWLIIVLIVLLAAVILALIYIPGSAVARWATGTAAVAGALSALWKLIQTRLGSIAAQVEQPLWGAELNMAAAEAITVPPLGASQDPAWESAFEQRRRGDAGGGDGSRQIGMRGRVSPPARSAARTRCRRCGRSPWTGPDRCPGS